MHALGAGKDADPYICLRVQHGCWCSTHHINFPRRKGLSIWCAFPLPTPGRSHLVPWLLTRLASYLPTLLGEAFERPMHQKILWLCDYPWKNSCNYPWKIDVLMYSMCKLNKQGDNIQPWLTHFPIWNQSVIPHLVLTVASWPAYRFFRRQVRCPGIPTSLGIVYSLLWSTQSKALA